MLFKLSFRNLRRSVKDYLIYFFTLVLGVAIFYVFNSLESQTVMMNVSGATHDLITLMGSVMSVLSVFVAIVLGCLILYASRFLMKRRKKEFGIYMTLGMSKSQISLILVLETLLIGIFSLVIGLVLGVLLSQVMSVFVANMFEADMTNFQFIFSESAFLTTIGLFSLIYIIVIAFSAISVGRQKLINLIHSDKTGEKIKIRNLAVSIVLFIAAIAILATAYIGVNADVAHLSESAVLVYIVMGIIGTFLLFWSFSGLALRFIMRLKGFYHKNLNIFIFREWSSKINTTVISMSIISLLLFLTIGIFSSAMSIKNSITENLEELVPADFQATKFTDPRMISEGDAESDRKIRLSAKDTLAELGLSPDKYFRSYVDFPIYNDEDITYRQTIGEAAITKTTKYTTGEFLEMALNNREYIVKLSDYNTLAKFYDKPEIHLNSDEYAVLADYDSMVDTRNYALSHSSPTITFGDKTLKPNQPEVTKGFIEMSAQNINSGFIIVPDEVDLSGKEARSFFVGNYIATAKEDIYITEDRITEAFQKIRNDNEYWIFKDTRSSIYADSIGLRAMATFVGLYLGIVFLISSAALLGLKEISDSSDNQAKYRTLRDLGVDQKTLNRTLATQIAMFFGLPLFVACIHSIFGIMFAHNILLTFANQNLLQSIIITALFILIIYGGYYLITYYTSKRIIMSKD